MSAGGGKDIDTDIAKICGLILIYYIHGAVKPPGQKRYPSRGLYNCITVFIYQPPVEPT